MNTEEREISLIDLLIYVAKGWRSILIWMLIMAIAVSGVQYVREVKAAKEYADEEPATEEEEKEQTILTMEQLRQEMPEEEIKAVNKVVRLEKDYIGQLDYLQNSLLMTMDPYDVSVARLQYWVDTDYKVDYTGVNGKDLTADMVEAYLNRVEDDGWKKAGLKKAGADTELRYFNEMVTTIDANSSFTIIVKYSDQKQLRTIIAALEEDLEEYQDKVTEIFGKHTLALVNESVETTVDNDIYNTQYNRRNILLNLENNIASYKAAFNEDQKSLYAGQILVDEDELSEGENDSEQAGDEAEDLAPLTPQIRVKNILLGAILGAFLVCMIRAMVYILSGKLKAEDNVEAYLGVAGLGGIAENKKEQKGAFGKLDAWLDSLSRRNIGNLTKEQQLKMVASNILLYCEKDNRKQIYLNSSVNCLEEKAGELVRMLEERGIEVKDGFSILQDASAMEEMSKTDGVVFMEEAGKSRYEDLEREVKLCKEHGKTVIGLVVLS